MTTRAAATYQPTFGTVPGDWANDAACKTSQWPDAWHPDSECGMDSKSAAAYATSICKECPVRVDCLQWALEAGPTATYGGIYGGTTHSQRIKTRPVGRG